MNAPISPSTSTVHIVRWLISAAWCGYLIWGLLVIVLQVTRTAVMNAAFWNQQPQPIPASHVLWLLVYWVGCVLLPFVVSVVPCVCARWVAMRVTPCAPSTRQRATRNLSALMEAGEWWCIVAVRCVAIWWTARLIHQCAYSAHDHVSFNLYRYLRLEPDPSPIRFDALGILRDFAQQQSANFVFVVLLWLAAPVLGRLAARGMSSGCRCCGYGADGGVVTSPCPECGDRTA